MTTSGGPPASQPPLDVLVLGGTSWLGGEVAALARLRGHRVTCLARGESGSVPEGVTHVTADRWQGSAYEKVADRVWDVVVDVSWQPDLVRSALAALAARAGHWVYVSSVSVYADQGAPGADESAALLDAWAGAGEADDGSYGPAKVSCETSFRAAVAPDRLTVARAGLIVGYGDRSDRFGYWPARLTDAEDPEALVLVPPLDLPVQVIDVSDLARWLVDAAERRLAGTFDAVGKQVSFEEVISACALATGTEPLLAEPDELWLVDQGVTPWTGPDSLPLWLPRPDHAGLMARDGTAARAAGLASRPLAETVAAALAWEVEQGLDRPRKAGLSVERENTLLALLLGQETGPPQTK